MERQRDSLVPIGEAISGPGDPVEAIHSASPQASHHFTQAAQVNQLVGASEASPDLGFMARLMALCSMPRLLLAWVCTEAVQTQSRVLVLGGSVAEFMRKLDIYSSSGEKYTRLREQMQRLFNVHVQLIYEDAHGEVSINSLVADRTELWWNPKHPNERSLWESKIELGEKFFEEIISHPVPLDMNTLKALKRSSLGLDWYLWLTYRVFSLKRPLRLTWPSLYRQFGANPEQADDNRIVQDFRKDCLRELKKIKAAWPDLNYTTAKGLLILSPSKPSIPPEEQLSLVNQPTKSRFPSLNCP